MSRKSRKELKSGQDARRKKQGIHPRAVVSGYYGFDNLGDELILRVLTDELKARDIRVTVLSNNPKKTAAQYGVDAIHRMNLIDIIDALAQSNLFISGGGGLFQDATGPMSVLYYGGLIRLARFFEVPVCFWAQGVGPLNRDFSRRFTAGALRQCQAVAVRDEKSADLVETIAGFRPQVTRDPVWLLKLPKKKTGRNGIVAAAGEAFRIGVSLRHWPDLTPKRLEALAECLQDLAAGAPGPVEFLLLPFQAEEDLPLLTRLRNLLKKPDGNSDTHGVPPTLALPHKGGGDFCKADSSSCNNPKYNDPKETFTVEIVSSESVIDRLGDCGVLIGMRFHSLILALLYGIPVYGLVYDPKVAALLDMFDLQGTPIDALEHLHAANIRACLDQYPAVDLKPLQKKARENFSLLNRLLDIPEAELVL